jgi:electron transport complex protein RnfD
MTKQQTTPNITTIMLEVILACLPAIFITSFIFGIGIIYNILFAVIFSISLESLCLKLRAKPIALYLSDFSAIVTAILLAMCLPPYFNVIKIAIGIFFSIVISKHIYGGLGHNIFNPAMVGYIILLVAFPQDFTNWQIENDIFNFNIADDITQATPLDPIVSKSYIYNQISYYYAINTAWLLGGCYLLAKKIVPVALASGFIIGLFMTTCLCFVMNISTNYLPWQHLFLGATMMGAWFIVSDPVTAPVTNHGRWLYSILCGILCFLIREFGKYPDGVGFAILFMNTWVPLINKITKKSSYVK